MSNNDYDVIVCKVLVYLYKKYKRIDVPKDYLTPMTKDFPVCQEMFNETLAMMLDEGLIKGATHAGPILFLDSTKLTVKGLEYIHENSAVMKTYKGLKELRDWLPF